MRGRRSHSQDTLIQLQDGSLRELDLGAVFSAGAWLCGVCGRVDQTPAVLRGPAPACGHTAGICVDRVRAAARVVAPGTVLAV
jgi:hypothetical protein